MNAPDDDDFPRLPPHESARWDRLIEVFVNNRNTPLSGNMLIRIAFNRSANGQEYATLKAMVAAGELRFNGQRYQINTVEDDPCQPCA